MGFHLSARCKGFKDGLRDLPATLRPLDVEATIARAVEFRDGLRDRLALLPLEAKGELRSRLAALRPLDVEAAIARAAKFKDGFQDRLALLPLQAKDAIIVIPSKFKDGLRTQLEMKLPDFRFPVDLAVFAVINGIKMAVLIVYKSILFDDDLTGFFYPMGMKGFEEACCWATTYSSFIVVAGALKKLRGLDHNKKPQYDIVPFALSHNKKHDQNNMVASGVAFSLFVDFKDMWTRHEAAFIFGSTFVFAQFVVTRLGLYAQLVEDKKLEVDLGPSFSKSRESLEDFAKALYG